MAWMDLNIQTEAMQNPIHPGASQSLYNKLLSMVIMIEEALRIHLLMKERRNKANMLYLVTNPKAGAYFWIQNVFGISGSR